MIDTYRKIFSLFDREEKSRARGLILMMLVVALIDVVGATSIMPFFAILADPDVLKSNNILRDVYDLVGSHGVNGPQSFLFYLGVCVFVLLISSLMLRAYTIYSVTRFTFTCEYSIGRRLMESYLKQPYYWFLGENSSLLTKEVISEVSQVVHQSMVPAFNFISQAVVGAALILLLIIVDAGIALSAGVAFGFVYFAASRFFRGFISLAGRERLRSNRDRFANVSEAFGAIKEVKLLALEEYYLQRFSVPAATYARQQSSSQLIGQLPRFLFEAIAFGGMLTMALYTISQGFNMSDLLPVLALYAFAGYRLLPAMQQIYNAASEMRYSHVALEKLHADIKKHVGRNGFMPSSAYNSVPNFSFRDNICLDGVYFTYPDSLAPSLIDVNMSIRAKSAVAIVGPSGSGKTTLIDVILGLLEAQSGSLKIDGLTINYSNSNSWQGLIGYVPQHIFLVDGTIESNIAFGVKDEEIDRQALERAAKAANIHDFIVGLPRKYSTSVGERGVRLSGGQRQRIGIARALYRDPDVIVFDEATSALDPLNEQAITDTIGLFLHKKTIILIAHRFNTIQSCDYVVFLNKGRVESVGSYNDLLRDSPQFRSFVLGDQQGEADGAR